MEYPYQLATFIASEPRVGEPVYGGENGWYPQIALKRRFKLEGISEDELIAQIEAYCAAHSAFTVKTGELIKPERMPVRIIEIDHSPELVDFHTGFITTMGNAIQSRYPERDGGNYLPHITAEYDGEMVIEPNDFKNRDIYIKRIWLLKDIDNQDSKAYKAFTLGK